MRFFHYTHFALILAFLCACPSAEAGPIRNVARFVAGKAKAAATAPLRVRPLRRLVGRGC